MAYQPKSYKKFVATAATATLVASALVPVASAAFNDVNKNYTEAVEYLVSNGIAKGITETTFGTDLSITRGDAAVMIANALKLDTTKAPESAFTDLNNRVEGAVNALSAKGIISGKNATEFAPAENITRAEMAKVIANAYELDGTGVNNTFNDVNSTFDEYVDALVKNEITLGKTPEAFGSTLDVTRGEFALFVFRAENLTPATPEVVSAKAINALEVGVEFNVAVDKTDAEDELKYSINGLTPESALLSADGKTVTLKFANATQVEVTDGVIVVEGVKTAKDATVKTSKYSSVFTYSDTVRPTITSVTYDNYYTAKVWFSEPISDEGSVQISDANASYTHVAGDNFITVNLANASVAMDKNISVTIVGATDFSGNLVSPNPVTTTVQKTKSDTVKPEVSGITVLGTSKFSVKFTEELSAAPTVKINGTDITAIAGTTITKDATDKSKWNVVLGTAQTGVKTVAVDAGYTDISGNAGAAFSQLVEFKADTTAPAYVKHEVKTIANVQYLVVSFNEEVTNAAGTITGSYVDSNQVTHSVTDLGAVSLHDSNADGTNDAVKVNLTGQNTGAYSVSLPAGLAEDLATNDTVAKSVAFTLGNSSDSDKPGVSNVVVAANKVTVTFSENVSGATALNLANYKVEGESLFTSAIFKGNQQTVELTLREGSITVDGLRQLSVTNVSDLNGNTMNTFNTKETFTENVKPVVSAAKLTTADTVTVTFSEAMTEAKLEDATADFKVKVDGAFKTITNLEYQAASKSLVITFSTAITDLSKPMNLDILSGNNVTDTNGNALSTSGSLVITQ